MPSLLAFAPCIQALTDANDHTLSLVSIFSGLDVNVQDQDSELPTDLVLPIVWSVGCLWKRTPEEADMSVEQRTRLINPLNNVALEISTGMNWTKPTTSVINKFAGFPVSPAGDYKVEVSLRSNDEGDWHDFHTFPITVRMVPAGHTEQS